MEKSKMTATDGLKCINVQLRIIFFTKHGRNLNEMCCCVFSYMGNLVPSSVSK